MSCKDGNVISILEKTTSIGTTAEIIRINVKDKRGERASLRKTSTEALLQRLKISCLKNSVLELNE